MQCELRRRTQFASVESLPVAHPLCQYPRPAMLPSAPMFPPLRNNPATLVPLVARVAALALFICAVPPAHAGVEFGDDAGNWANDGECDDPRFEGEGSASALLNADRLHDATDCRTLFERGLVRLRGDATAGPAASIAGRSDLAAGRAVEHRGSLTKGDDKLKTGEYFDQYEIEGSDGQHLSIALESDAFDAYLILQGPRGRQIENDDAEGAGADGGSSSIEADLAHAGVYRILVTSYEPGESGDYRLVIRGSPSSRPHRPVSRTGTITARLDPNVEPRSGERHARVAP